MPNYSSKPFLTACDEEYLMLIEVCEEFEKQKAFQLGATYYITKPYTKEDVKRVFTQYL